MSLSMLQHESPPRMFGSNSALHLQLQQHREKDRRVRYLNNRACVLVLSKGDYSEANKLFDSALMIHKEQTEETYPTESFAVETAASLPTVQPLSSHECYEGCDSSSHSDDLDLSEGDLDEYEYEYEYDEDDDEDDDDDDDEDFGDMDWDGKEEMHTTSIDSQLALHESHSTVGSSSSNTTTTTTPLHDNASNTTNNNNASKIVRETPPTPNRNKIPRMTSYSRLQSISYCGQQDYLEEYGQQQPLHDHNHHQVYSLPIVMDETEWESAPVQDKSFVLIFNTALCNHLWGMQLMQQYLNNTTNTNSTNNTESAPSEAMAQHCRDTLTVAKLLYKLALENSVSFANGVDKMCYVALYNNLSHVLKTLDGYDSMEAQWCDDMLLKAIFWWRDSTHPQQQQQQQQQPVPPFPSRSSQRSEHHQQQRGSSFQQHPSDLYLDDDVEIIDAFFENVFYRVGVPEDIVPAAAA